MTALFAFLLTVASIPAAVPLEPIRVVSTAYSCDAESPMYPCNTTRWGNDPLLPGIAAPPEWAGQSLYVPRYGVLTVDDTGRYPYLVLDGVERPHVDIRVDSHGEAVAFGIRRIVIYRWIVPVRGQERKGV